MQTPDNWVKLRITNDKGDTKVSLLSGWSGGYLGPDVWRLSSNIVKEGQEGDYYLFTTESGTKYKCHKNSQCLRSSTSGVYSQLKELYEVEDIHHPGLTLD